MKSRLEHKSQVTLVIRCFLIYKTGLIKAAVSLGCRRMKGPNTWEVLKSACQTVGTQDHKPLLAHLPANLEAAAGCLCLLRFIQHKNLIWKLLGKRTLAPRCHPALSTSQRVPEPNSPKTDSRTETILLMNWLKGNS